MEATEEYDCTDKDMGCFQSVCGFITHPPKDSLKGTTAHGGLKRARTVNSRGTHGMQWPSGGSRHMILN